MTPLLENIAEAISYDELPETWRLPEPLRFSKDKSLYEYQRAALENAARALFKYYGDTHDWSPSESELQKDQRKFYFQSLYTEHPFSMTAKYESRHHKRDDRQKEIFRILAEYLHYEGGRIAYHQLINRMGFWMATGSGKTLVMIKLIEYLHFLQRHQEIPQHPILILAPSDHLLKQIKNSVAEFNESRDLFIHLVALREKHRRYQGLLGNAMSVYYQRSDLISNVQKEALTDYRQYENDGKWFILLDEAHKGSKDDSKRQAYYSVMARDGFLFNFSATFTDKEDIATTVKKYNLEEFIKHGYGKKIYLNQNEYSAFKNRSSELSLDERREIVLKSLITLAYISLQVEALRNDTALGAELYHLPLMLTLVNSVNTNIETEQNDLWAFFETLRDIATGEVAQKSFDNAKEALIDDWQKAHFLFEKKEGDLLGDNKKIIRKMSVAQLRRRVFLSARKGGLQYIRSRDNKELAFQMKNADSPFALIRIGDVSKWRKKLLVSYEETKTLQEKSYFDKLEQSNITILMGSRAFFESWDSKRPNIINFINIGGLDAKKFVVQSVGRGVRIAPLPNQRRRLEQLLPSLDDQYRVVLQPQLNRVSPIETLFLFATNRRAIKSVLEGLQSEQAAIFEVLEGFELEAKPRVNGAEMPLLIPDYQEVDQNTAHQQKFALSEESLKRLKAYLEQTSDAVLMIRDQLSKPKIDQLRALVAQQGGLKIVPKKHYAQITFLLDRLLSCMDKKVKRTDGLRKLKEEEPDQDIVHFRRISAHWAHSENLQALIKQVKAGRAATEDIVQLTEALKKETISREEFDMRVLGKNEAHYDRGVPSSLRIKKLLNHYYAPVVLGDVKADYIRHIIKIDSEINFLNQLEEQTKKQNNMGWDAWMFSKVDESVDKVYIPYFNMAHNDYSRFLPDFVFWMCKDKQYRIVFVDPKGTAYADSYHKIDGYKKLFEQEANIREFSYAKKWRVSVKLLMFGPQEKVAHEYSRYWSDQTGDIFA